MTGQRPWLPADPSTRVLLLDFDGVINAICDRGKEPRMSTRTTIALDPLTKVLLGASSAVQGRVSPVVGCVVP